MRIGKSKHHVRKTQFNKEFDPIRQKGRRIPIHLQERVEAELNKLIDQKHNIKLDKCLDEQFISPIVLTVKKDRTVKLLLDSKKINKFIHKNKYQKPNIDLLLETYYTKVKSDKSNQTLFSTLDLRYACSQIPLDKTTREQCNFSPFGGNATGTYQFQTGFAVLRICQNCRIKLINAHKLHQYIRVSRRYTDCDEKIGGVTSSKTPNSFNKTRG